MAEMKLLIGVLRALEVGVPVSAESLARTLGVARAAVSAALVEARELGVPIDSSRGRGHVLRRRIDWLDVEHVSRALGRHADAFDVRIVDHVGSTNDAILAIDNAQAGRTLVVTAELQEGGRGRRGRRWNSGVANALTFSLLWRVCEQQSLLSASSLVVGVGLHRALTELGATDIQLKWPNDLLCKSGKLGGVLIEGVPQRGAGTLVIGIGINVHLPEDVRASIDQAVADLETLGVSAQRATILGCCLRHLHDVLTQFDREGFGQLRKEWLSHAAYLGSSVTLRQTHGAVEGGILAGIDDQGALLLASAQGSRRIYSGDVSLRAASAGEGGGSQS